MLKLKDRKQDLKFVFLCVCLTGLGLFVFLMVSGAQVNDQAGLGREDKRQADKPFPEGWNIEFRGRYLHEPVKEKKCGLCHKEGPENYELKREGAEMCLICHYQMGEKEKEYKYIHQPVRDNCLGCHRPHDSEEPGLLTKPDPQLCIDCHVEVEQINSHPIGPQVIDPNTGQPMTCTSSCHAPHYSRYNNLLRIEGKRKLCISCHKEFERL